MPDVLADPGSPEHRMVQAAGHVLEVGDQRPGARVDAEEVVHVHIRPIGLGPAFSDQRDRVRDAAATRTRACARTGPLNHTSSVNVETPSPGAGPNVTYRVEPSNDNAYWFGGGADKVAWASLE